jgi:asparagine synthetase B (glutamine-hydrolysing)
MTEYCYCFNGEIYNYKQLKVNLENRGVFLNQIGYKVILLPMVKSFQCDGMFAFSIHDKNK